MLLGLPELLHEIFFVIGPAKEPGNEAFKLRFESGARVAGGSITHAVKSEFRSLYGATRPWACRHGQRSVGGGPSGVGVGDAETAENGGLEPFHRVGIAFVLMIHSAGMQYTMNNEVGGMVIRPLALLARLGLDDGHAQEEVGR